MTASRRRFIRSGLALCGLAVLAGCGSPAATVRPARPARIGFLVQGTLATSAANIDALRQGLRELGYIEGHNLTLEIRAASRGK